MKNDEAAHTRCFGNCAYGDLPAIISKGLGKQLDGRCFKKLPGTLVEGPFELVLPLLN